MSITGLKMRRLDCQIGMDFVLHFSKAYGIMETTEESALQLREVFF